MADLQHELETALSAVRIASGVCANVQSNLVNADSMSKKDRSPVTVADFASQAVICAALKRQFPQDPVVAEESSEVLRGDGQNEIAGTVVQLVRKALCDTQDAPQNDDQVFDLIDLGNGQASKDRFWTLDPIDGTKGFLRGEQYCVALALIVQGQVVMGVMGCPNLPLEGDGDPGPAGLMMAAVTDEPTQIIALADNKNQGMQVKVDQISEAASARFCESVESGHSNKGGAAAVASELGITAEPIRIDSQCKYAAIARGDASIYLRLPVTPGRREQIWDHAAGVICVEQAGGVVTDVFGKPLDFSKGTRLVDNRGIIASNGRFHEQIVQAVGQAATIPD